MVKVNPGSLFVQTMMGWSLRCYILSFVVIGLPVPEEKIFKGFTIYGHDGHLGHVTWTIYTNFRSPFLERLYIKFDFDWPSSFRGEDLKFCRTTTDAGPMVSYRLTYEPLAQVAQVS